MNAVTGRIFNIARYAIHDGPGIRTTVFLKGCPLRCQWCCSPESQSFDVEKNSVNGKVYGRDVTVDELFSEVRRDEPFWHKSGGGVTLSGGEVLSQAEFADEFLGLCREHFIHTTIETALFATKGALQKVASVCDMVIFDIKAMAPELHKRLTGVDNRVILENAAWLLESRNPLLVRFPLIPSVNDSRDNIEAVGAFVAKHRQGATVEVLKYHKMGAGTYEALGREYSLVNVKPPEGPELEQACNILKKYPIEVIHS